MEAKEILALSGLVIGAVFGFIVERTNFCTMGAISDATAFGDWKRLRAWLLAIATAALGTQALAAAGMLDLAKTIYFGASLGWVGAIVGGLMFGFGMTLAGGCASRNLVRLGAGDLRSLVVLLVLGFSAYMTLRGLTAIPRVAIEGATNIDLAAHGLATQGLAPMLAKGFGAGVPTMQLALTAIVVLPIVWFCFKDPDFRGSRLHWLSGIGVGLTIVAGWYATGVLAVDEFEPTRPVSLTYTAPVGNALVYLMTFTGATIDFGIASVGGAIAGAWLSAVLRKSFHVGTFADKGDLVRNLAGAVLMGMGGVAALGCTIGQGVTGISTLALGSVIALAALIAGGVAGIKYMESIA